MDYICSPLSSQLSRGKNERGKKKHDANFPTLTLFDTHAEQKQTGQQIPNCKWEFVAISFFATTEKFTPGRNNQRGRRKKGMTQISPQSREPKKKATDIGN